MDNNSTTGSSGGVVPKSPLAAIKQLWLKTKKKDRTLEKFDTDGVQTNKITTHINNLFYQQRGCIDVLNPSKGTGCQCMNIICANCTDEDLDKCVSWLLEYCTIKSDASQQKEL